MLLFWRLDESVHSQPPRFGRKGVEQRALREPRDLKPGKTWDLTNKIYEISPVAEMKIMPK